MSKPQPMDCKPAHSGRRKAGYQQQQKTFQSPHHMPYGLSLLSLQSHQTMLTLWFRVVWASWRASGSSCIRAQWSSLAGNLHSLPAQQLIEKDLSACQASVSLCIACSQKHFATCGHLHGTHPPKGGDHKLGQCTCPSQGMFLSAA